MAWPSPPFHNAACADPIQFLAKHPDCFRAVVKFAELSRGQRCWLSERLDLNVDEYTDFILDDTGWGCHHGILDDILAGPSSSQPGFVWRVHCLALLIKMVLGFRTCEVVSNEISFSRRRFST